MIVNHWAGSGARAAGCYFMVGLDDAGDAAWLRAFGGGLPAEWNPEDGWSQFFEPEDEITVEATAFKDGLMILGPSEAPVAVVVDLNVTNTCPVPITGPRVVRASINGGSRHPQHRNGSHYPGLLRDLRHRLTKGDPRHESVVPQIAGSDQVVLLVLFRAWLPGVDDVDQRLS
jgi:hypothetical protein